MSMNLRNRTVPLRPSSHLRRARGNRNAADGSLSSNVPVLATPNSINTVSNTDISDITARVRTQLSMSPTGLLCEKYAGSESKNKVESWLDVFELVTGGYTDQQRLIAMGRHVSAEVVDWLSQDILPRYLTMTWSECRQLMIQRFGRVTVNPLVEASKRVLSPRETVLTYYNEKRRLLNRSGISELNQVAMLTEGMPELYRIQIASADPANTNQWLKIALAIEEAKQKRFSKSNTWTTGGNKDKEQHSLNAHDGDRNRKHVRKGNSAQDNTKPKDPCRYCTQQGRTEYHWHRQCPLRVGTANQSTNANASVTEPKASYAISSAFISYDVKINGKSTKLLLDTGSTITAVSLKTANRVGLKPDQSTSIPVSQVDGTARTNGSVTANVTIGQTTKAITVHVLPNLGQDGLLGLDAARAFGLSISFSKDKRSNEHMLHMIHNVIPEEDAKPETLEDLLEEYDMLFAQNDKDIGCIKDFEHKIRLKPDSLPFSKRPYRLSPERTKELKAHIDDMLAKGIIRPSCSPYASPMFLVPKKDGGSRPVVDFRWLNEQTISERQPLPIVQDLIDKLSGSKVFSKVDVAWAFWNVKLDAESIEKTAFVTPFGQYEFLVLPFGLKNASSVFQRRFQHLLKEFLNSNVEVFVDDSILHTVDEASHLSLLRKVFQVLLRAGVRLRKSKCEFLVRKVEFLSHVVSAGSVRPSPVKVKSVAEYPIPSNVLGIQQFLGLVNYYRNFIQNFSAKAKPLTSLTRKGSVFLWGSEQQSAFDTLRLELTKEPILTIYDEKLPIILQTDASMVGLGAILMQRTLNDQLHVIAYWSCTLNDAETRYGSTELECYAVVRAVEYFHIYLDGTHFDVYTDCAALKWLFEIKNSKSRLFRWAVRLAPYHYTIHYRPGITNQAADALSRNPVSLLIDIDLLQARQSEIDIQSIRKPVTGKGLIKVKYNGIERVVVPDSLRRVVLEQCHDELNHPGKAKTLSIICAQYWWSTRDKDVNDYVKTCHSCQTVKPPNEARLGGSFPIETPDMPNEVWAMDTIVLRTPGTIRPYIVSVIDHHSRFVWASFVKNNTAEASINILSRLFNSVGKPQSILTDNGTNFTAKRFKNYLQTSGIRHMLTPPYHPQSNGCIEKANDAIMKGIRLAMNDNSRLVLSKALSTALSGYNDQPHTSTGFTPRFLHFGLMTPGFPKPAESLENARVKAAQQSRSEQNNRKQRIEAKHQTSNFVIGDYVKWRFPSNHPSRTKLSTAFVAPCVVAERIGYETYRIDQLDLKTKSVVRTLVAHSSSLMPYYVRDRCFVLHMSSVLNWEAFRDPKPELSNFENLWPTKQNLRSPEKIDILWPTEQILRTAGFISNRYYHYGHYNFYYLKIEFSFNFELLIINRDGAIKHFAKRFATIDVIYRHSRYSKKMSDSANNVKDPLEQERIWDDMCRKEDEAQELKRVQQLAWEEWCALNGGQPVENWAKIDPTYDSPPQRNTYFGSNLYGNDNWITFYPTTGRTGPLNYRSKAWYAQLADYDELRSESDIRADVRRFLQQIKHIEHRLQFSWITFRSHAATIYFANAFDVEAWKLAAKDRLLTHVLTWEPVEIEEPIVFVEPMPGQRGWD